MGKEGRHCYRAVLIGATSLLLLGGCNKASDEVKVYRLAKAPTEATPPPPAAVAPPSMSQMPPNLPMAAAPASAGKQVPAPPNWEAQPPSQMRQASYLVRGPEGTTTDISLVILGGSMANVLDNVNRWLGQLGQPPITQAQLTEVAQRLPGVTQEVTVVDLQGKPEQGDPKKDGRIVAAMTATANGTSFFKMRGNPELTGAEKENFLKWVRDSCQ